MVDDNKSLRVREVVRSRKREAGRDRVDDKEEVGIKKNGSRRET